MNSLTNNISLIEVIDELTVPVSFDVDPANGFLEDALVPASLALVTSFERDDRNVPERLLGRLSLVGPAGRTADTNFNIDLEAFVRVRCILSQNGLIVREPGIYRYRIAVQDQSGEFTEVTTVPLEVKLAPIGVAS